MTIVPPREKKHLTFLLGFLLTLGAGCASNPGITDREGHEMDRIREVRKRLSAIRELLFLEPARIRFEDMETMRSYLEAGLIEEYGEEKLKNRALAYAKLGLVPAGTDLKKSLLYLYAQGVEAFYDPNEKSIVIRGNPYIVSGRGDTVLVHELTHALQDQNFNLQEIVGRSDNDDRSLALRSVAEGDAILTEWIYSWEGSRGDPWGSLDEALREVSTVSSPTLSQLPVAIVDKLFFGSAAGAPFVLHALKEQGWQGVNYLYRSPPLSTEQVLHPEKYFESPDPPTPIRLSNLGSLFSPDWSEIERNTLGELMVLCLFKQFLPLEEAKAVASGWDGDRFVAFRRGEEVSFIWVSVWDSSADGEEFFEKYREVSRKLRPHPSSGSGSHGERRGHIVAIVAGLERVRIEENIEQFFQELELEEVSLQSDAHHKPDNEEESLAN